METLVIEGLALVGLSIVIAPAGLITLVVAYFLFVLFDHFSSKAVKVICSLVIAACPFIVTHCWIAFVFLRGNVFIRTWDRILFQKTWEIAHMPFCVGVISCILCAFVAIAAARESYLCEECSQDHDSDEIIEG